MYPKNLKPHLTQVLVCTIIFRETKILISPLERCLVHHSRLWTPFDESVKSLLPPTGDGRMFRPDQRKNSREYCQVHWNGSSCKMGGGWSSHCGFQLGEAVSFVKLYHRFPRHFFISAVCTATGNSFQVKQVNRAASAVIAAFQIKAILCV